MFQPITKLIPNPSVKQTTCKRGFCLANLTSASPFTPEHNVSPFSSTSVASVACVGKEANTCFSQLHNWGQTISISGKLPMFSLSPSLRLFHLCLCNSCGMTNIVSLRPGDHKGCILDRNSSPLNTGPTSTSLE